MHGYYRIAAITPAVVPGDVEYNCAEIMRLCKEAAANGAVMLFLPHLAVTGSSCGELFFHPEMQHESHNRRKQHSQRKSPDKAGIVDIGRKHHQIHLAGGNYKPVQKYPQYQPYQSAHYRKGIVLRSLQ